MHERKAASPLCLPCLSCLPLPCGEEEEEEELHICLWCLWLTNEKTMTGMPIAPCQTMAGSLMQSLHPHPRSVILISLSDQSEKRQEHGQNMKRQGRKEGMGEGREIQDLSLLGHLTHTPAHLQGTMALISHLSHLFSSPVSHLCMEL